MTTKFKERLIALSRSKKVEKIGNITIAIIFVLILISLITSKTLSLYAVCVITLIVVCFEMLDGVKRQEEDIIRKNKLRNVIFSDRGPVFALTLWSGTLFTAFLFDFIEMSEIFAIVYLIIFFISVFLIPTIVTSYFSKKLSK